MAKNIELGKTIRVDGLFRKCIKFDESKGVALLECSPNEDFDKVTSYDICRCKWQEAAQLPKSMGGGMLSQGWFAPSSGQWGKNGLTVNSLQYAKSIFNSWAQ